MGEIILFPKWKKELEKQQHEAELLAIVERLSVSDRRAIVQLLESGDEVRAVKRMREITGAGLKQLKQIADAREKYLI